MKSKFAKLIALLALAPGAAFASICGVICTIIGWFTTGICLVSTIVIILVCIRYGEPGFCEEVGEELIEECLQWQETAEEVCEDVLCE